MMVSFSCIQDDSEFWMGNCWEARVVGFLGFHLSNINNGQVFNNNMDKDMVVLLAARAARMENQDAIDAAIVNMLSDPKEVKTKDTHLTLMLKFSNPIF